MFRKHFPYVKHNFKTRIEKENNNKRILNICYTRNREQLTSCRYLVENKNNCNTKQQKVSST